MNWVKARAECTARSLFQALRERVEADVGEFNNHDIGRQCVFVDESPRYFLVSLRSPGQGVVKFRANGHCISVECADETRDFYVKIEWADDTDTCRLVVDGLPLELWQVTKRALSPLMFGEARRETP